MAGVGARAQQQEISGTFGGGGLLWPFQVSVDRTWVPRDTRKVLKTFFPCHQLQPSVCSQALLHTCSHSPSLVLKLVDKGKCNMATGPRNKGKSDLVPPSCSHTACGCKDTWERLSATQAPCLVLGPGLLLQGGKRKGTHRPGGLIWGPPRCWGIQKERRDSPEKLPECPPPRQDSLRRSKEEGHTVSEASQLMP